MTLIEELEKLEINNERIAKTLGRIIIGGSDAPALRACELVLELQGTKKSESPVVKIIYEGNPEYENKTTNVLQS